MKKILFIIILLFPFIVKAEYDESKITIESFGMSYKEGYGSETSTPTISGRTVNFSYEVSDIGDKIIFDMTIKNTSGEDIELYNRTSTSNHIEYLLTTSDLNYVVKNNTSKTFQLQVKYVNPVEENDLENGPYNDTYTYSLVVSNELGQEDGMHNIEDVPTGDEDELDGPIDNPYTNVTFTHILLIVSGIFIISIAVILIIRKKKSLTNIVIIIIALGIITPIVAYALKTVKISLKSSVSIKKPIVVYPEGKNKNTVTTGDIVKISNEEFYVIDKTEEDLVLLAKYNLKVGDVIVGSNITPYSSSDQGYGLQNATETGTLKFSDTNYWNNNVGDGKTYPGAYSHPNYPYVYDSNSKLEQYVINYKNYLTSKGAYIKEARLLKYSEAIKLGCSNTDETCSAAPDYVTSTSYWLGNAQYPALVWTINQDKGFFGEATITNTSYGVRPVIVLGTPTETHEVTEPSLPTAVCKRATTLHQEECTSTTYFSCKTMGYTADGDRHTTTIIYGGLGTKGTLTNGDAFDCDVNGDGVYNPETERFYYLNTTGNYANLVYYNNTVNGVPNSTTTVSYYSPGHNWYGPIDGVKHMPTTSQWSNVQLSNVDRNIVNEKKTKTTAGGTLPTTFSYEGYAARMITIHDIIGTCINSYTDDAYFSIDSCNYLLENTDFNKSTNAGGYWLETPVSSHNRSIYSIRGGSAHLSGNDGAEYANNNISDGVRPVIEIPLSDIDY